MLKLTKTQTSKPAYLSITPRQAGSFKGVISSVAVSLSLLGCTTSKVEPLVDPIVAEQSAKQSKRTQTNLFEKFLERLDKEPLKEYEVDEAFLAAETLVQEKQFETAEKLYRRIFDIVPSLVVGLKLARLKTLLGDVSGAEGTTRRLTLLFPSNAEPALAMSYLAQLRGSKSEALDILDQTYKRHPTNEEVAARYTEFLLEEGKKNKAKEILDASLKRMPNSPYFLLRLARLKAEDKDHKSAKNLLDRLLRIAPDNIEGWTLAGYIASEEGNFENAERYFREAYEKQPENDTLARYYVTQLLRQNKFLEARRLLLRLETSADAQTPLDPELSFQLGLVLFQLEEYPEARTRFLGLLSKTTEPGRIYYYIGQCDELRKEQKTARENYQKIPENSDFYQLGLQRIVYLAMDAGEFDEARKLLSTYKIEKSEGDHAYRFIAMVHARLKEYKKATSVVQEGLKVYPKSPDLGYLAAAYIEFTQSKDASLLELEKFISRHPTYTPALNHLGYSLAEVGRKLDLAVSLLKRAVAREPKNGFYLDSLGWALFRQARFAETERYLIQALQLEPDEPVILEHIGELKVAKKEFALALKYFERAEATFTAKPSWKIDADQEWKLSSERVKKRIQELRRRALPNDQNSDLEKKATQG